MSNNLYDILGKLNKLEQSAQQSAEQPKAKTKLAENIESVEGKLNEKYMGFKKVASAAKAGGAKDPEAVAASIGRKKYGKEKFQKAAAAGKKLGEGKVKQLAMDLEELTDEEFKAKYHVTKAQARKNLGAGEQVKEIPGEKSVAEGEKVKVPGGIVHKGNYGSEVDVNKDGKVVKKATGTGQRGRPRKDSGDVKPDWSAFGVTGKKVELPKWKGARKIKGAANVDTVDEVAPPGAKAERMVKHIKKSYSKDGKLTPKEKAIAYATAWKAHNAGKVEEAAAAIKTLVDSGMTPKQITEGWVSIVSAAKNTRKTVVESYTDAYDQSLATEGSVVDMLKAGAKKVANVVAPDDKTLMKDLAKKTGVPVPANTPEVKEETCSECGMAECACDTGHSEEQDGHLSVSTSMDSAGNQSVSVNASGDEAAKLSELLKLAGLGNSREQAVYQPVEVAVSDAVPAAEVEVDEELANEPAEEVFGTEVQLKGGNGEVAGKEKQMHKDGAARFSDNPLAMRENVYKEYEAIKVKKQ